MYDNRRFYKGEDIRFFVTIRDNDGQLENISNNYQDVILYFYNENDPNRSVVRASKTEHNGFIPIVKAYLSEKGNYVYECIIDSKTTEMMPAGQYIVETNVARNSSTEFTEQSIVVTGGTSNGVKTDLSINFNKTTNKITASNVLFTSSNAVSPGNPEAEYFCNLDAVFNNLTCEFKGTLSKLVLDETDGTSYPYYPYESGEISGKYEILGDFIVLEANGKWNTGITGANDNYDRSGKKVFKISAKMPFTYTDENETVGIVSSALNNDEAEISGSLKTGVKYHKLNNIGRARAFKLSNALIKRESDIMPWEEDEMKSTNPEYRGHHRMHPHDIVRRNDDLSDDDRGFYRY